MTFKFLVLGTDNPLYEDDGSDNYSHITIAKEMGVADLDFVRYLNSQITPGVCCNNPFIKLQTK